ncbi:MAG: hypothetical protein KY443_01195 [Actinobacteria bacterium]|nr:hypothetical protein [Actinomycetota bacterium]
MTHSFRRRVLCGLALGLVTSGSAACGDDQAPVMEEGNTAGCREAFKAAASMPSTPRMEQTLLACDGLGAWVPAAAAHPELVPTDAQTRFAATMCAAANQRDIRDTKTCREALARHPEATDQPGPGPDEGSIPRDPRDPGAGDG